jgi:hypothetical protein
LRLEIAVYQRDHDEVLAPLNLTKKQMGQPDARLTHDQGRAFVRRMLQLTGQVTPEPKDKWKVQML